MKKFLALAAFCAAATSTALAASPWDGSWKLDTAKSHLTGPSWTYTKTAAGLWHFSDGGNYAYDFAVDGKPYALATAGDTQTATMDGTKAINFTFKHGEKVISTMHEELFADGKTLTDHTTGTREDGSKLDDTVVNARVGTGTGFLGKWKSTKVQNTPSSGFTLAVGADGSVDWEVPSDKQIMKGKMDGSNFIITGPNASPDITVSMKKVTATKADYWVKLKGKPLTVGSMALSADGKWLTDTSWTPGKESEKTMAVYMKN